MLNFREELDKIKREKPRDLFQEEALSILNDSVLKELRTLKWEHFKKIDKISFDFSGKKAIIRIMSDTGTISTLERYVLQQPQSREKIIQAVKDILKESYEEDQLIVTGEKNFFIII